MSWSEAQKLAAISTAHERRLALIKELGGRCALCHSKRKKLEIDHVDGRDWEPRRLNRWARVNRYWREYHAGVRLRVLCRSCNGGYRP